MNGLEYIHNTKNKLKSRFQGKGVEVNDSTPFGKYPDFLESDLKNKSWQYPSYWCQLTPKNEFEADTVEFIVSDEFCKDNLELKLLVITAVSVSPNISIKVSPAVSGLSYYINDNAVLMDSDYVIDSALGEVNIRIPKGYGIKDLNNNTTYKITVCAEGMTKIHLHRPDNSFVSEIVAVRTKCSWEGIEIPLYNSNTKYADLSLTLNPNTLFENCKQLIKVELPQNYVLKSNQFKNCENLIEVVGADFTNTHEAEYVFYNCYRYTPISLNYYGKYNYHNVNLWGSNLTISGSYYPINFVSPFIYAPTEEGEISNSYNLHLNVEGFNHNSLNNLRNAIIYVPERACSIDYLVPEAEMTDYLEDSFLVNYTSLLNGDKLQLDNPVGVYIDCFSNFKDTEINLPKVPLLWLVANYNESGTYGPIKRVRFKTDGSNFDTLLGKISLQHQDLNKEAILELFSLLPNSTLGSTIDLTGCHGLYDLTSSELEILSAKNWVLIK